jgi:phosphoglucosamine mutase
VISASHNAYDDNGIKFFDAEGGKLSDELEEQIETQLTRGPVTRESGLLGRAARVDKSRVAYQEFCAATRPPGVDLSGLKIVIDCANGAAYKVGPRVLTDLGAEIVPVGCSPNGRNINDGCGSMAPQLLQLTVPGVRADVGIALDGDGDRLVMVDHLGRVVDGDQLLYIMARARKREGTLTGPVVGTVMSNFGLEQALKTQGIDFQRAAVGDRYVLGLLRETGGVLGGETSGHILCLDQTTTGDALISALQVLSIMKRTRQSLAELAAGMQRFPQVLLNVKVAQRFDPATVPAIQNSVRSIEARLGGEGRVVLRPSGTEPVIRVMVEGRDERATRAYADELAAVVRAAVA